MMAESLIRGNVGIKQIFAQSIDASNNNIAFTDFDKYVFFIMEIMYQGYRTTINATTLEAMKYMQIGYKHQSSVVMTVSHSDGFTFSDFDLQGTNQYFIIRVLGVYSA